MAAALTLRLGEGRGETPPVNSGSGVQVPEIARVPPSVVQCGQPRWKPGTLNPALNLTAARFPADTSTVRDSQS